MPTQLESESSEDEQEDETEADAKKIGYENATQYDEDIDEEDAKLAPNEILVGIEKAAYLVRYHKSEHVSTFFLVVEKSTHYFFADDVQ